MANYEIIFGLDCVGGDQAPVDCAVVKTNDGKPGIMLDGEVFTKDSLTPAANKLPIVVSGGEASLSAEDLLGATTIRSGVFAYWDGLISITIPDSVTSIGDGAFEGCDWLESVVIGSGVTDIGGMTFSDSDNITTFRILATTPPAADKIFGGSSSGGTVKMPPCTIYVPEESVDAYKSASGWSPYAAYIEADPN